MKSEELRIGNWVSGDIIVSLGNHKVISEDIDDFEYKRIELKPIPLTEDWLVKFGLFKKGDCFIINHNFKIDFMGCVYCKSDFIGVKCHYVHTFQNLYFALTNKELVLSIT
jgi:hypothetical protein